MRATSIATDDIVQTQGGSPIAPIPEDACVDATPALTSVILTTPERVVDSVDAVLAASKEVEASARYAVHTHCISAILTGCIARLMGRLARSTARWPT